MLTDTAAVYLGYGEYLARGYKIIETNLGLSYHKVGYIRQDDVVYIMNRIIFHYISLEMQIKRITSFT